MSDATDGMTDAIAQLCATIAGSRQPIDDAVAEFAEDMVFPYSDADKSAVIAAYHIMLIDAAAALLVSSLAQQEGEKTARSMATMKAEIDSLRTTMVSLAATPIAGAGGYHAPPPGGYTISGSGGKYVRRTDLVTGEITDESF